jgi:hypothetical protein
MNKKTIAFSMTSSIPIISNVIPLVNLPSKHIVKISGSDSIILNSRRLIG